MGISQQFLFSRRLIYIFLYYVRILIYILNNILLIDFYLTETCNAFHLATPFQSFLSNVLYKHA
jgi:hypothetical protein